MNLRPLPGLPSIQRRSSADHDLSQLFVEVSCARAADRAARCAQRTDGTFRSDSLRIAASLTAYTRALERYGAARAARNTR
jgi:hypothetical protein